MQDRRYKLSIYAICSIFILEIFALMKGIDGKVLALSIAALAGLAGWVMPSPIKKWRS